MRINKPGITAGRVIKLLNSVTSSRWSKLTADYLHDPNLMSIQEFLESVSYPKLVEYYDNLKQLQKTTQP